MVCLASVDEEGGVKKLSGALDGRRYLTFEASLAHLCELKITWRLIDVECWSESQARQMVAVHFGLLMVVLERNFV